MAANPVSSPVTIEEYFEFERSASEKNEYYRGQIIGMAGGSPRHALLAANFFLALGRRLEAGRCNPFSSDLRVWIAPFMVAYPDVSVVCGEPQYSDSRRDTITNPTLIVEVLSPSTENYDRSVKARHYRDVASLQEFLLIDQNTVDIDHYRRSANGIWEIAVCRDRNAVIALNSIGCELPVEEIYRNAEIFGDFAS